MPVPEPYDSNGLWEAVRGTAPWPTSNEDAVEELGFAWFTVGQDFVTEGSAGDGGIGTAWPDPAGIDYLNTVNAIKAETRTAGEAMIKLGNRTREFAGDVRYAKEQISLNVKDIYSGAYGYAVELGEGPAYAAQVAAILVRFLDAMAARVAARGAADTPFSRAEVDFIGVPDPADQLSVRERIGYDREVQVAEAIGGTVVGRPGRPQLLIQEPGPGQTDVDVIGPDGEFVAVGGGAKANDLRDTVRQLEIIQANAVRAGTHAEAWFTRDTPPHVIAEAESIVGAGNVYLF